MYSRLLSGRIGGVAAVPVAEALTTPSCMDEHRAGTRGPGVPWFRHLLHTRDRPLWTLGEGKHVGDENGAGATLATRVPTAIMEAPSATIVLDHVSKNFGPVQALREVSLVVWPGEVAPLSPRPTRLERHRGAARPAQYQRRVARRLRHYLRGHRAPVILARRAACVRLTPTATSCNPL